MRGIKRLAHAASGAARSPNGLIQNRTTCALCQPRPLQARAICSSRRNYATGDRDALKPANSSRLDEEGMRTELEQDDQLHSPRKSEFEYDIEPDPELNSADTIVFSQQALSPSQRENMQAMRVRSREARIRREERKLALEQQQKETSDIHTEIEIKKNSTYGGYEEATSWDQTAFMGGERIMEEGGPFRGFLRRKAHQPQTQAQATIAMYRAVVETFASAASGIPNLKHAITPETLNQRNWTQDVRVEVVKAGERGEEGTVRLHFPSEEIERRVLGLEVQEIDGDEVASEAMASSNDEALVQSWGRQWLHISLEDPDVKFAIVKRLTHYLGRPISDHAIHKSSTVFILLHHIAKPPPALKVFEALAQTEKPTADLRRKRPVRDPKLDLLSMPNVKVMPRRHTTLDKEMALGRWKLVERELKARNLPVFAGRKSSQFKNTGIVKLE